MSEQRIVLTIPQKVLLAERTDPAEFRPRTADVGGGQAIRERFLKW